MKPLKNIKVKSHFKYTIFDDAVFYGLFEYFIGSHKQHFKHEYIEGSSYTNGDSFPSLLLSRWWTHKRFYLEINILEERKIKIKTKNIKNLKKKTELLLSFCGEVCKFSIICFARFSQPFCLVVNVQSG